MKKIIRLIAVAAMLGLGLVGVGLMTNTASADTPCNTINGNAPTLTLAPGCAYVSVNGIDPVNGTSCGTQVVLEDGNTNNANNVGYIGVSNCDRDYDGASDSDIVGVTPVNGGACSDRYGQVPSSGGGTNGGGCYSLEIQPGLVVDVDLGEVGEIAPETGAVPLLVGGDDSGDYNGTTRDGQGAAICDALDTIDNFEDFILTNTVGPIDPDNDGNTGVLAFTDC